MLIFNRPTSRKLSLNTLPKFPRIDRDFVESGRPTNTGHFTRLVRLGPVILSHRGNIDGAAGEAENSVAHCRRALALGFGLETDLRRTADGRFYISHDPVAVTQANSLDTYLPLIASHPTAVFALNIKELGYEAELVRLRQTGMFCIASFYFDFELLEPTTPGRAQRSLRALSGGAKPRLAARISDRGESVEQALSIPAEVIWADEFDRFWLTEDVIEHLKEAGRSVFAVSPELHGFDRDARLSRWADFKRWKVDGICTDYAREARGYFDT